MQDTELYKHLKNLNYEIPAEIKSVWAFWRQDRDLLLEIFNIVKKNYRSLALIYHPDKNNGVDTQMVALNSSWEYFESQYNHHTQEKRIITLAEKFEKERLNNLKIKETYQKIKSIPQPNNLTRVINVFDENLNYITFFSDINTAARKLNCSVDYLKSNISRKKIAGYYLVWSSGFVRKKSNLSFLERRRMSGRKSYHKNKMRMADKKRKYIVKKIINNKRWFYTINFNNGDTKYFTSLKSLIKYFNLSPNYITTKKSKRYKRLEKALDAKLKIDKIPVKNIVNMYLNGQIKALEPLCMYVNILKEINSGNLNIKS